KAVEPQARSVRYLPFRHRNQGVFWCQVETGTETIDGQAVTISLLRRLPSPVTAASPPADGGRGDLLSFQALAAGLPVATVLIDRQGRVVWANAAFYQEIRPAAAVLGQPLRNVFTTASAAALERLVRDRSHFDDTRRGRLVLEHADAQGQPRDFVAHWL